MRKSLFPLLSAAALAALASGSALAEDKVEIPMNLIGDNGIGKSIGTITAQDTKNGFLSLKMDLAAELPPGGHGFHIHENPSCDPAQQDGMMVAGLAAGGHYDPGHTGKHLGPSGEGHLGDLPILFVGIDEDGQTATKHTLVAPRLKLADIHGRSIVIHANSDNFRDEPKPGGGGGALIACGVIP